MAGQLTPCFLAPSQDLILEGAPADTLFILAEGIIETIEGERVVEEIQVLVLCQRFQ